jgi:hypothetical protein
LKLQPPPAATLRIGHSLAEKNSLGRMHFVLKSGRLPIFFSSGLSSWKATIGRPSNNFDLRFSVALRQAISKYTMSQLVVEATQKDTDIPRKILLLSHWDCMED